MSNEKKIKDLMARLVAMTPDPPPYPEEIPMARHPERRKKSRPALVFAGAAALVVALAVPLLLFSGGNGPVAGETTTTSTANAVSTAPAPTTTTQDPTTTTAPATTTTSANEGEEGLDLSDELWVTHRPEGIQLDDGTLIWETQPFPTGLARDRQGGLVFTDSSGLWWFQAQATEPTLVGQVRDELITVVPTSTGPVAMTMGDGPAFYALSDGEPVDAPPETPVEVSSETPWLWRWTATNGIETWVTDPEAEWTAEGQPSEILEPAHLIVVRGEETLVDTRIGEVNEAWSRIHDFDGQRLIVSRGPYEPAMAEETFLLIDLATGEVKELFIAGGTSATLTGTDVDWTGPVQTPDLGG